MSYENPYLSAEQLPTGDAMAGATIGWRVTTLGNSAGKQNRLAAKARSHSIFAILYAPGAGRSRRLCRRPTIPDLLSGYDDMLSRESTGLNRKRKLFTVPTTTDEAIDCNAYDITTNQEAIRSFASITHDLPKWNRR